LAHDEKAGQSAFLPSIPLVVGLVMLNSKARIDRVRCEVRAQPSEARRLGI
jgi:hypothetical protein